MENLKTYFIRFNEDTENIIYSKEANIIGKKMNFLTFNLINGFKLNFVNKEIEKLEFEKYKLKITLFKKVKIYNNIDKNSQTII